MDIKVPYGQSHVSVTVPDSRVAGIVYPNTVACGDETELLRIALENPICSPGFREFMQGNGKTLIVVNDGSRPTPTRTVLDSIWNTIRDTDYAFIVATGTHRAPTEDEFEFIFGEYWEIVRDQGRVAVHDAHNQDELVMIGITPRGTEVWVNKRVVEADRIVVIGSVEPHYFAGYTGGRKAFFPGLSAYSTISQNHRYALRPESITMALAENPVHEDMIDALNFLKQSRIFSIQTVLSHDRRIYAASAGHIIHSMNAAIEYADTVYAVKIPSRQDIVVSVAPYPMDIDLYQSQKAMDHGKLALNRGGILIIVSQCRTGIGPDSFYRLMSSCDTVRDVLEKISDTYKLGYHKASKMAEICQWASMWAVTDLEPRVLENIFIRPFSSLQAAIDAALAAKGWEARIIFLMEGSTTVPKVTTG